MDFFDFITRGDFSKGSYLLLDNLSLVILRFNIVEVSL